jgi:AraC-like DNA-binding protein
MEVLRRTNWAGGSDLHLGSLMGGVEKSGWDWRIRSSKSIWLWLNVAGEGLIWGRNERFVLKPGMFAMTGGGEESMWQCIRYPGMHRLDWVEIPGDWLRQRIGAEAHRLRGSLADWVRDGRPVAFCGLMGVWERDLSEALIKATEQQGSMRLIAEARLLEWAAMRLFDVTCTSDENVHAPSSAHGDGVRRAIQLLQEHLDQPLDLSMIAKRVGFSPHHLSRRVRVETGFTLQQHLRKMRIGHACEALASGRMNITEVALEVGYQSLSHFAKAFREETGEAPKAWITSQKDGKNRH